MPMITDIGHIILQVGNMEEALRLYRDVLGFEVDEKRSSPIWKIIMTKGAELTVYQGKEVTPLILRDKEETPINLHVASFEQAADELEAKGYRVMRHGKSSGTLVDPWDNHIGLHDHLQG